MTLYCYSTNFDMDGYRTCANAEETYTFGVIKWRTDIGKGVHIPFRKFVIEDVKETSKGYKDQHGNLYLKKDMDTVQIINHTGSRINCSINYYSLNDSVSFEEIKNKFIQKVLAAFNVDEG